MIDRVIGHLRDRALTELLLDTGNRELDRLRLRVARNAASFNLCLRCYLLASCHILVLPMGPGLIRSLAPHLT